MTEKNKESRVIFGASLRDEVTFKANVETKIDDVITKKITAAAAWVVTVLLSIVFGGIITSLWELNGKIHTVIGQESMQAEIAEINKKRIELLNDEKKVLESKIDVLKEELSKVKGTLK